MGRRKFFIFHCFIAVLFCGILQGNAAQPRATEILERLAAGFRAMDGYGVKFGVVSGDYEARGSYVVEGDSYYLVLGDAEVFADGRHRYDAPPLAFVRLRRRTGAGERAGGRAPRWARPAVR